MSNSNIPQIDILTDTWQTVITRVNSLITSLSSEIITANSSASYTGTLISPRNATLFGTFTANTLAITSGGFSVNNSIITLGTNKLTANGSTGVTGFVLASGGAGGNLYWRSITVTNGTVTNVANGAGLTGGPITSSGTLAVKAGSGIIVNASGVSVDPSILTSGTVTNVANGAGLTGGPITSSGTLAVKAGTGIVVNANGVNVTNPTLRHVSSGYNSGGQVFVQSTQPTATAQGDIWIQI